MQLLTSIDSHRVKLIKTALCVISFIGLGGANTLLGSSLLDLQIRIQETFRVTSNLVTARSIGYLIGGITAGFIDRWLGANMILFITNLIAGVTIGMAPWFESFYIMYAFILVSGFAQGIYDIVCYTFVLRIWRDDNSCSNYVQILHGAFGVGALITPLISQPFLLPVLDDDQTNNTSTANVTIISYEPSDVKVQWAFLSITAMLLISATGFLMFHLKMKSNQKKMQFVEETTIGQPKRSKIFAIIGFMAFLSNTASGISIIVGSLIPAFVVKSDLRMTKNAGATLITVFWLVLTFYRLIFVTISNFIDEKYLMIFSYCCQMASIFVLVPHAASNQYCIWIGLNLVGIGYAPLFTVTLSRLQRYFLVSNALASFIVISGSIGEVIHPWIASKLIDRKPVTFTYYLAAISLANMITCIIIPIICEKIFKTENKRQCSRTASIQSNKF